MRFSVPRAILVGLAAFAVLGGCVPTAGTGSRVDATLSRQPVLAGAVMIAAPKGYCIEPASRLERGDSALIMLGRCAAETGVPPALLTATVGENGSGTGIGSDGATLARWFQSERGRAALSDRGRPGDVQIARIEGKGETLFLRVNDRGTMGGAQAEGWRAVLPLRGRLVTLTVAGPRETPLSVENGRALIGQFVDALRKANP